MSGPWALVRGLGFSLPAAGSVRAHNRGRLVSFTRHNRMITYQPTRWWQNAWVLVLGVLALIGAGTWFWGRLPAGEVAEAASAPKVVRAAIQTAYLVPPKVLPDGRPSDFSAEDWAALQDAAARTPDPKAELARVVAYLRFQKGVAAWQQMQDSGDVVQRRQLAATLLTQVPERLKQSEVTYDEAAMLQMALLADIEPDEASRRARMEAAQDALRAAAPEVDPGLQARDERLTREYKQREAAILADYQSRPEGQRNHQKLEQDLEAARRAVWGRGR